jgi:hypothetical protein
MHSTCTPAEPKWRMRRRPKPMTGFLYVAVLFITLIVMATVAAGLSISTSSLRGDTDRSSRLEALRLAESEIHRQAALMKTSSSWRTAATNNVFSSWQSISVDGVPMTSIQVRHRIFDSDGDLADDPTDPVELTVHAKIGRSEAAVGVRLESNPVPLDLLQYSVTTNRHLRFDTWSGGVLTCERPVQVSRNCLGNSSGVITTPRLECDGNVKITLRGDLADDSVTLPSQDVFSYYVALGTEIPREAIPQTGDGNGNLTLEIKDRLISPTANPFGDTDPAGIYWIDADNRTVSISHCRIEATLVILDAAGVEVKEGITWNYPNSADVILAADSDISLKHLDTPLDEADRGVNFNPPSSPYRQTLANSTTNDVYPPELRGIIYSTHNLELVHTHNNWAHLTGLIVCKNLWVDNAWLTITHLDELLSNPPPPFADPTSMRFVRGTYRRVPSP